MTISDIAKMFSNGDFKKTYDFIAEDAEWTVVEENNFIGKQAIIDNCEQIGNYFKSVTTNFICLNIISEEKKVVVNGTAGFLKDNKRLLFVSACDLYEFNEKNQIQKITSYCIQAK